MLTNPDLKTCASIYISEQVRLGARAARLQCSRSKAAAVPGYFSIGDVPTRVQEEKVLLAVRQILTLHTDPD